ncbi:NRDE family protein [Dyadobacter pollutisoli]|uniref:NRDE family protein n=1 Tax=Dyadobacter pollutisoli TaxID=2910158 RepID=A0A9E8NDE9_9BACT|nr:NRDE family protein [Dyadobacter pollutisoli]WAC14680.1 NRDE family protein [Dyadobacter pollutisoli]
MCTVSYLPGQNGFILTSSRDEKLTRPVAKLSEPILIHGQEVTFPSDPQGNGTWIASSNARTVCLLNGAFTAHTPAPPYRHSRGLVVLNAFDYFTVQSFIANYDFGGLEPFTLLLVEKETLVVLRWNGRQLFVVEKDPAVPHIWSSATLYEPEMIVKREKWFSEWLDSLKEISLDGIREFHKRAGEDDPENAIRMRRGDVFATVSLTSVIRSGTQMEMIYEDLIHSETIHKTLSRHYVSN